MEQHRPRTPVRPLLTSCSLDELQRTILALHCTLPEYRLRPQPLELGCRCCGWSLTKPPKPYSIYDLRSMADPEERPPQSDDRNDALPEGRQCSERRIPDTMSTTNLVAGLRSIKHKGSSEMRTRPPVKTSHTIVSQQNPDRPLSSVFSSPMRPKSTPFPLPPSEPASSNEGTDDTWRSRQHQPTENASASSLSVNSQPAGEQSLTTLQFSDLPTEIHEAR